MRGGEEGGEMERDGGEQMSAGERQEGGGWRVEAAPVPVECTSRADAAAPSPTKHKH